MTLLACNGVSTASGTFCVVIMGTTGFLFLRRVHAVYADKCLIRWLFSFLWFTASSVVISLIPGSFGKHIPGTKYCAVYAEGRWAPFNNFMPAIFDTLVFIAVSYRLSFQTIQELGTQKGWTASWFSARGLPTLSQAILRGGQLYYLSVKPLEVFTPHVLIQMLSVAFLVQFVSRLLPFQKFHPWNEQGSVHGPWRSIICMSGLSHIELWWKRFTAMEGASRPRRCRLLTSPPGISLDIQMR